ncbi:MAG: hypothetical protein R3F48_00175 [Candidatus Zixiibacteriota bacterium]
MYISYIAYAISIILCSCFSPVQGDANGIGNVNRHSISEMIDGNKIRVKEFIDAINAPYNNIYYYDDLSQGVLTSCVIDYGYYKIRLSVDTLPKCIEYHFNDSTMLDSIKTRQINHINIEYKKLTTIMTKEFFVKDAIDIIHKDSLRQGENLVRLIIERIMSNCNELNESEIKQTSKMKCYVKNVHNVLCIELNYAAKDDYYISPCECIRKLKDCVESDYESLVIDIYF